MSTPRGRSRRLVGLVGAAVAIGLGSAVARRWLDAVEVAGGSMAPSLLPGDRLIVESATYARRSPRVGEIVLAADPRQPGRELIKRVVLVDPTAGTVELRGDAPEASTDSRAFGAVPSKSVRWRVAFRYWPAERVGPA